VQPYEARFAAIFGADYYAFCFWKGRVALYSILKALDLEENDQVILPGYTCVVVPNAIRYAGAQPIYADIALGDYNLDPRSVEERVTSDTRALIVQHTYGIPADLASLKHIADNHGLCLIEDCAHILVGSTYQGRLLGSFGKAAFFSFQWSKPYTTGLGGMVVTRDVQLAKRLTDLQASFQNPPLHRGLQLHLQYSLYHRFFNPKVYWLSQKSLHALSKIGIFVGSSNGSELEGKEPSDIRCKMSKFQQRVGLAQIEKLDENCRQRKLIAQLYWDTFRERRWPLNESLNLPHINLVRFPIQVEKKAKVLDASRRAQVELGSWFETPLHPLPLEKHHLIGYQLGSCPNAETVARNVINLPLHPRVTETEAERVVGFVLTHTSPASVRRR
jgi:perosamine synthetase